MKYAFAAALVVIGYLTVALQHSHADVKYWRTEYEDQCADASAKNASQSALTFMLRNLTDWFLTRARTE